MRTLLIVLATLLLSACSGGFDNVGARPISGDAKAQYNLGAMYYSGQGAAQDYSEAARWFTESAEQGFADSQHNLGVMYDNGQGVTQDHKEAVKWYTKSAEQGHANAQYKIGDM